MDSGRFCFCGGWGVPPFAVANDAWDGRLPIFGFFACARSDVSYFWAGLIGSRWLVPAWERAVVCCRKRYPTLPEDEAAGRGWGARTGNCECGVLRLLRMTE